MIFDISWLLGLYKMAARQVFAFFGFVRRSSRLSMFFSPWSLLSIFWFLRSTFCRGNIIQGSCCLDFLVYIITAWLFICMRVRSISLHCVAHAMISIVICYLIFNFLLISVIML